MSRIQVDHARVGTGIAWGKLVLTHGFTCGSQRSWHDSCRPAPLLTHETTCDRHRKRLTNVDMCGPKWDPIATT